MYGTKTVYTIMDVLITLVFVGACSVISGGLYTSFVAKKNWVKYTFVIGGAFVMIVGCLAFVFVALFFTTTK